MWVGGCSQRVWLIIIDIKNLGDGSSVVFCPLHWGAGSWVSSDGEILDCWPPPSLALIEEREDRPTQSHPGKVIYNWTTWHSPVSQGLNKLFMIFFFQMFQILKICHPWIILLDLPAIIGNVIVPVTPGLRLQSLIKVEELKPRCETRCHYNSLQRSHKTEQHSTSWPGTRAKSRQFTPNMFVGKFSAFFPRVF